MSGRTGALRSWYVPREAPCLWRAKKRYFLINFAKIKICCQVLAPFADSLLEIPYLVCSTRASAKQTAFSRAVRGGESEGLA